MSDRKLPDDRELEEFLAGRSEVSKRYRDANPGEAAPPELDPLVIKRAREALKPRPRRSKFVVPVALAASLIVTFSLVLNVREETGGSPLPQPATVARDNEAAAPAAAAPAAKAEGFTRREADVREHRQDERKKESTAQNKPKAFAQPAPAAPAPPAVEMQSAEPAPLQNSMDSGSGGAAMRVAPSAARSSLKALSDEKVKQTAPEWLARIRALQSEGKLDDARRELETFHLAYPDEQIPDDLQVLLNPKR